MQLKATPPKSMLNQLVPWRGLGLRLSVIAALALLLNTVVRAEEIGSVRTVFHLMGANDKIVVEAFDDPAVPGVTCYLSRATKGGISGTLGLAEDPSDASIACRQTAAIALRADIESGKRDGEEVFQKSTSLLFKSMQVVRFYDPSRTTLVYLSYSNKLIEGSPKNSISAVAIRPWP